MKLIRKIADILKEKNFGNYQKIEADHRKIINNESFLSDVFKELDNKDYLLKEVKEFGQNHNHALERKANSWRIISSKINPSKRRSIFPLLTLKSLSIAASFILFFTGMYLFYDKYSTVEFDVHMTKLPRFIPGKNQAVIKLSNGEVIGLDENSLGLSFEGDIHYLNGVSNHLNQDQINRSEKLVIETPIGGYYKIVLPDGTKVWLNSLSSISYPKVFEDSERRVQILGEVYFEVAHNPLKPFIVEYEGESVKVLGTSFNINSYKDQQSNFITLFDGSIEFKSQACKGLILNPGQQVVSEPSRWKVKHVKTEEVIAWKNGDFMFDDTPLSSVMKQLSRWYEFEYELDEDLEDVKIWGIISKKTDLSEIFKIIKLTDANIKIKIEERRIKILK